MQTRFDTESRIAVTQAADIARELGHREVGPGHLLAGLLANPRGTAYAALRDHGLELDTARDLVAAHHVDDRAGDTRPARTTSRRPPVATTRTARPSRPSASTSTASARPCAPTSAPTWPRAGPTDPTAGRAASGGGDAAVAAGAGATTATTDDDQDDHEHAGEGRGRGRRGPRSRREGPRFSRELRAVLRDARRYVAARPARGRRPRRGTSRARHDRRAAARRPDPVRRPGGTGRARRLDRDDGLRAQAEAAVAPSTTS